tara:strand:+ start:209 stop:646 length:438 start_codon:yes stop_codon:yes gene_type:complete
MIFYLIITAIISGCTAKVGAYFRNFLTFISFGLSIQILLTNNIIPNEYILKSWLIFIIFCLPPIQNLNAKLAFLITKDKGTKRELLMIGDEFTSSLAQLIYNISWIEFATTITNPWIIYLNFFLSISGLTSFFVYAILNRSLHKK